jgi:hypothetical protein
LEHVYRPLLLALHPTRHLASLNATLPIEGRVKK